MGIATLSTPGKINLPGKFRFKKPSLTVQIIAGFLLGGLAGLNADALSHLLGIAPEGLQHAFLACSQMFLHTIKMIIAPLLLATLVVGIAGTGDAKKFGRLGFKTILYFEIATTLALVIGLLIANWLQPGNGLHIQVSELTMRELANIKASAAHVSQLGFWDHLLSMIPESGINAMSNNNILQLVFFSVFFALSLQAAGEKGKPVLKVMESLAEVMFKFVGFVMALAPLGVFGAIAYTLSQYGPAILVTYAKLAGCVYLALLLFIVLVLFSACAIAKIPFPRLLKAIKEPWLLAFTTASSESALPKAMTQMERFGVPKEVVSFVMPTGYSFNLDGSTLYLALAALFVAQMAGIHLPIEQQLLMMLTLMLTSKGVAAVPRASLVILLGTLAAFNLPVEGVAVILGIDHILDMGRTSVNLLGNCVASAVVARWEGVLDDRKMMTFDVEPEELALSDLLVAVSDTPSSEPASPTTHLAQALS